MWSKPWCHKSYRSLKQLPIPEWSWNSISMDFIEKLSSFFRFDTSWLAYQAKWSLSLPMTPSHLFILYIFSKHGIPSHITSDRDLEFVSKIFHSLNTALDMQLHFTSDYHPEGDGQTKHMNQTLKQYFCIYCNYQQDNWSKLLLLVELIWSEVKLHVQSSI